MINDIRLKFSALRDAGLPAAGDVSVLQSGLDERAYLGLDHLGRPHVLLVSDAPEPVVADIATLEVSTRTLSIDGAARRLLDLTCLFESVAEVFDHFAVAVVERLQVKGVEPSAAVGEVLEQWRQFLTPAAAPPGRDKLAPVFGELIVLKDIVEADPESRIDCWVGPHGARHDFRRGHTAIEVKTTRAHTSRIVTIHGEDQLVAPEGGSLCLHLVRLEEVSEAGRSVATVVDELLAAGVSAEKLYASLAAVGIPPADLPGTSEVRFDVLERLSFPVDADCPRIVPETFAGGSRPVGVVDVNYKIDLDHVLDRALDSEASAAAISTLAGGGPS